MILVVDDHPQTRRSLQRLLEMSGFNAAAAQSGSDALSIMKTTTPSCVLLDQMMAEMNGLDVFREMRKNPNLANVPVVFFTAVDSDPVREEALKNGAAGWIVKGTSAWDGILSTLEKIGLRREEQ